MYTSPAVTTPGEPSVSGRCHTFVSFTSRRSTRFTYRKDLRKIPSCFLQRKGKRSHFQICPEHSPLHKKTCLQKKLFPKGQTDQGCTKPNQHEGREMLNSSPLLAFLPYQKKDLVSVTSQGPWAPKRPRPNRIHRTLLLTQA